MIGYVTLGVNDLARSAPFYDDLFAAAGAGRLWTDERMIIYGQEIDRPMVAICTPYDGGAASAGNGTMVALAMPDRATADRMHAKALELGASCDGPPGLRAPEEMQFYGAYFRSADGHKFCAFKMGPEA
jgi:predicted lactoylglutathione lyase